MDPKIKELVDQLLDLLVEETGLSRGRVEEQMFGLLAWAVSNVLEGRLIASLGSINHDNYVTCELELFNALRDLCGKDVRVPTL